MKPKCLFISPTKYYYKDIFPENIKYHILSLMSHIADLADVEMVDMEKLYGYMHSEEEIKSFLENAANLLRRYSPDIVGISCYTSFDYLCTVDLLRICSRLYPQAVLIVGGYHPTAVPEDFLQEDIPVNFIIRGEGENALKDIIIKNGKDLPVIIEGKPLDLNSEKPLRFDLYPYKTYELSVALSRGCSHKCSFCVQSDDYPNQYRRENFERIKEKIERAAEHLALKRFLFTDPFFGVHTDTTIELLEYLKKKFPQISFWAETRIDRVNREWLKRVPPLDFDLQFGVESLAADTLQLMHKTKNPEQYNESFFKAIEMCQEYRILSRFGFIMNFPGELVESYQHTIRQMQKAINFYKDINFTFHCNQYSLYPGNQIYKERFELAKSRGFYFPNDGWWRLKEPDMRKRSEHCYASFSIVDRFGENPHFWTDNMLQMKQNLVSKYTFKTYACYQKSEFNDSLKDYYKNKMYEMGSDKYYEQIDLLAQFRFSLINYLYKQKKLIAVHYPACIETFTRVFHYITYKFQKDLLSDYDKGAGIVELYERIDENSRILNMECSENISVIKEAKTDYLEFDLLGKRYRISPEGKILYSDKKKMDYYPEIHSDFCKRDA